MKSAQILAWIFKLTGAIILLQTLFFKFTAAPESVYIFSKVGIEPWGRIAAGIVELVCSVLLLIPATSWLGATLGLGIMSGAILSHLTVLGIEVQGDKGVLFLMALIVFVSCAGVLIIDRQHAVEAIRKFQFNFHNTSSGDE